MPNELKTDNRNLNILSLNAQSKNAKFDNLQILIKALEETRYQTACNMYPRELAKQRLKSWIISARRLQVFCSRQTM